MPVPLLNDPWDRVKALSGAGDRQHRLRGTVLLRGYTMDVVATRSCRAFMLSLALLCCTELLPAQTTNCDNTTIPTLTPPAGLAGVDPDTLLRESACTPGAMGTRTPLILIHGLDGTSDIANPDLTVFMNLSLFLTQQDPSFSQNYKIFTYHYLSNEYTVSEIGLALEIWLDYFRQSWDPYAEGDTPFDRDVVIIGHSMGGLVARALMNEDSISAGAKAGLPAGERVIRAITLATPHHGTALVNSTTLRLHGQSEPSWEIVLNALDLGWAESCPACITNITLPNRGDLRCDAYCANDIFSSTPTLYSGDDVNEWLINLASTYNSKVNAYYGSLGSYGEVPTYGADDATAIYTELVTLALALGEESLQPSSTAGLTPAELADFHELLQLMSIIQERIDLDDWSGDLTSVLNDGAVPEISASFEGATVAKRVSCVTSDHVDMLEGTGGLCTDQTTNLTGTLFPVLDADLESLVPSGTGPLASLSPTSLSFAGQGLGTTSGSQPVTLSNTGNAALAITGMATSANFRQTNNCGTSVAAGSSCTINVTFTPTATGTLTGTLTITDNSNGVAGSTQSVALSGTGQDFTLAVSSGSPTSTTVAPGQAATYTLSVEGQGGSNQTVTFTCTGAPSEAACTVSPNPLTAGSSATNITVSVATTGPSLSVPRSRPLPPAPPLSPWPTGSLILAVLLSGVAWVVRGWEQPQLSRVCATFVTLAAGLLLILAMAGCGGGGVGTNVTSNPGTPAGTYTLTVTGSTGMGAASLSHSVTLTLNVS